MDKDKKPAKLNRRDLKSGVVVIQANNNLFYKNGKGKMYVLVSTLKDEPRTYTTFIPECNGDNDIWDEHLEIVGADCEVWVTEKWIVLNSDGENLTKDIHAFLCKWSTAVKKYSNLITGSLSIDDIIAMVERGAKLNKYYDEKSKSYTYKVDNIKISKKYWMEVHRIYKDSTTDLEGEGYFEILNKD